MQRQPVTGHTTGPDQQRGRGASRHRRIGDTPYPDEADPCDLASGCGMVDGIPKKTFAQRSECVVNAE